jgi:hypothetical protein
VASGEPNFGGIGFVSFPKNKECGSDVHRRYLEKYIPNLASDLQRLVHSAPSNPHQVAFIYYEKRSHSSFPLIQAATDLSVLICRTFEDLNRLKI